MRLGPAPLLFSRLVDRAARAAGAALLFLPFVPLVALYGPVPGAALLVAPADWALGIGIFGAAAWTLALVLSGREAGLARQIGRLMGSPGAVLLVALLVLATILLVVGRTVFEFRPHHVDSIVQLFQAKIFAAGLISAPAPPDLAFFDTLHMVVTDGRWYSQYPPGHAALLSPGVLAGFPWLVPAALTIGSAALLAAFARVAYDRATATVTAMLLVACPFFWIMGASFMNHVSALFFVAFFLWAWARWDAGGGTGWSAAAGAALGAAFLSRPLTALAVGSLFGAFALAVERDRRGALLAAAFGFLVVAALYLAFNAATTGDPFRLGYVELWGAEHGLGFHAAPWGTPHTPGAGLRNELVDLALLESLLFEWPIPSLWPIGFLFVLGWAAGRWDRRLLFGFLVIPAAYFFYWHRDAYLGPRFLYETVAFIVPLTARALVEACRRLRHRGLRLGRAGRPVDGAALAAVLATLCVAYAATYSAPRRVEAYAAGWESMERDVVDEARAAGIEQGVLFVATTWGDRLIAEMRGLGVPAGLVERAYRRADHCALARVVDRAQAEAWRRARTAAVLERLTAGPPAPLVRPSPNGDPTLRLESRGTLDPRCREEIDRDRQGTTIYAPHLLANGVRLESPLVIARDLGPWNANLLFPGQRGYRWRPGRFEPL